MKIVGKVTDEENDRVYNLLEKKNALKNLLQIIDEENENDFYSNVLNEYKLTEKNFQGWWEEMFSKYKWEENINAQYALNFEDNIVFIDE